MREAQIYALEELISRLMNDATVPGVSIAIIKDARLAWQRNFGQDYTCRWWRRKAVVGFRQRSGRWTGGIRAG
jgi:hypothetical protein